MAKRGRVTSSGSTSFPDEALEALSASLPDVEVVDRDVDLGGGRHIDLIGLDRVGKPWLFQWVQARDGEPAGGDSALLAALDAVAWFTEHASALARHLDRPRLAPELGPALALVSESFPARLVARSAALDPAVVQLLELRRLRTGRGEHAYLARLDPSRPRSRAQASVTPEEFLSGVPEARRELAARLLARMGRIDDALEARATLEGVTWLQGGGAMCDVRLQEGALVARTLPGGETHRLEDVADLDAFLAAVIEDYLRLAPDVAPGSPGEPRNGGPGPLPDWDEPLLTPEELAEFRA